MHAAWRFSLGTAVLVAGLAASGAPRAQAPMNEARCKTLMTIITGITMEYAGQISSDFLSDLHLSPATPRRR